MPLEYPGGSVSEHQAVRSGCGIFDVSHMGTLVVTGAEAVAALNDVFTNDLTRLAPGQLQYTLVCTPDGGVVDDMMVTLLRPDELLIVPNAANTSAVAAAIRERVGDEPLDDRSERTAILAVQGPGSPQVLRSLGLPTDHEYMTAATGSFEGAEVLVSRSGYTGERGYELLLADEHALALWEVLEETHLVTPCGLVARDTLRTEMGYPLHGQDIGPGISPVTALLGWAVGWDKPAFGGRDALVAERAAPGGRRLRGLLVTGRGIPRPGMTVRRAGADVGVTTSGTFSPTLRQGIALALLERDVAVGDEVSIDVRGRELGARVVKPPFVDASPR